MRIGRWKRWLLAVFLIAVPAAMGVSYWIATRSDAYRLATQLINTDPMIVKYTDSSRAPRLSFFDGYRYFSFGPDVRAEYRFTIGEARAVDLVLERAAGAWRLSEGRVTIGDETIELQPRLIE